MSRRYRIRWPVLIGLIAILVVVPLIAWLGFGVEILPFVILGILIVVVGAGGAGLRKWWGEDPSDVAQREAERRFESPGDEGRLL
jgi:hypothetical protein